VVQKTALLTPLLSFTSIIAGTLFSYLFLRQKSASLASTSVILARHVKVDHAAYIVGPQHMTPLRTAHLEPLLLNVSIVEAITSPLLMTAQMSLNIKWRYPWRPPRTSHSPTRKVAFFSSLSSFFSSLSSDPRYDFRNFPHLPRTKSSRSLPPPLVFLFNRFSPLANLQQQQEYFFPRKPYSLATQHPKCSFSFIRHLYSHVNSHPPSQSTIPSTPSLPSRSPYANVTSE